jgi:hypothetical protein
VNKAVKIIVVILVAASLLVLAHHLPTFEGLMRRIHGG